MSDTVKKTVPRVLIVDDVEANRFVLRNIIMDMECEPVLVESGSQALRLFPLVHPDLVLLDVAMPEMDGYELCKKLKSDLTTHNIPIIFISAIDDAAGIVRGFEVGGDDFISKPFIPEVVKVRVGVHLKVSYMTQNLMETNRRLKTSVSEQLKQIEREKKNVLYAITNVIRENSCYEQEHMERISKNCKVLAQAMQLSPLYEGTISDSYVECIEMAAPLCDVGNVAVPTHILHKNSSLTAEEMNVMKTHTVVGAKILGDVLGAGDSNDFLQMSVEIARSHHENWDGSGYPEGKEKNDIPLAAQVVSLIQAYCALTEKRVYRDAYTREEALEILAQESGVKFNPNIFAICQKIARQLC